MKGKMLSTGCAHPKSVEEEVWVMVHVHLRSKVVHGSERDNKNMTSVPTSDFDTVKLKARAVSNVCQMSLVIYIFWNDRPTGCPFRHFLFSKKTFR